MQLPKLNDYLANKGISPEELARKGKGDFSNMTVRRACQGQNIDDLKAKAIAKVLKVSIDALT